MNILLNFEFASSSEYLFDYTYYKFILKSLKKLRKHSEIKILVPQTLHEILKKKKKYKNLDLYSIKEKDYLNKSSSVMTFQEQIYRDDYSWEQFEYFSNLYPKTLNNWIPDIIFYFEISNTLLRKIYPDALHITYLGGLWKAIPPHFSLCFDPTGAWATSSLVNYASEIKQFKISAKNNEKINKLKDIFKHKIKKTSLCKKELEYLKNKYSKLILLPLSIHSFIFETENDSKSQLEFMEKVFKQVPEEIGVIVTTHHAAPIFTPALIEHYRNKYHNFIYIEKFENYSQSSLYCLPYVDAIINVTSSLGLKALLCDVKIISMGKYYNNWFKDAQGLENITELLNSPIKDKNNVIYWLLTHYDFVLPQYSNPNWICSYFERCLEKFRKSGINFNYFTEEQNIDKVINYYRRVKFNNKNNMPFYNKIKVGNKRTVQLFWGMIKYSYTKK